MFDFDMTVVEFLSVFGGAIWNWIWNNGTTISTFVMTISTFVIAYFTYVIGGSVKLQSEQLHIEKEIRDLSELFEFIPSFRNLVKEINGEKCHGIECIDEIIEKAINNFSERYNKKKSNFVDQSKHFPKMLQSCLFL